MTETIVIKVLRLGEMDTNCYVIWSKKTGQGYIIDPADAGDEISQYLLSEKIQLQGVLLTHGHFDHLLALLEVQLNFPAPIYLHQSDQFLLGRATATAEHFLGRKVDPVPTATLPLIDSQELQLGSVALSVMHTPGHTPGSCCFLLEAKNCQILSEHYIDSNTSILFTGDTLFSYGIEPLTHSYSRPLNLSSSLQKLSLLEKNTRILPGHGESVPVTDALANCKLLVH